MDIHFGRYQLHVSQRQLTGPDGPVELSARSLDILAQLLMRPDQVISKADLLDTVWPGLFVGENTLQVHVSALRRALGEGMIATVHGRGYKYAGPSPTGTYAPSSALARPAAETASPRKPSIAVLPFENRSGDPEQVYFSDGITEDIIIGLSRHRDFVVIARNSSFRYRGENTDLTEVARTLDVQYIVEGSVRKVGKRVRVSVTLTETTLAAHVWGEHFDRDLADIFSIQDEITEMIAARLARQTRTAMVTRSRARPTENMSAYDLYLRARQLAARDETVFEGEPLLRRAIDLDSQFAPAFALLGFVEVTKSFLSLEYDPAQSRLENGLALAKIALDLDPDETFAHLIAGYAQLYLGRFSQARTSLDRAVALNPNDPFVLSIHALFLSYTGHADDGLRELDEAQRLDPFAVGWFDDFRGIILTSAGRYREAVACYAGQETLTSWSLGYLTFGLAELGETEKARRTLARFKALWPQLSTDKIVEYEMCYFEDPAMCARFQAVFRRLEADN